MMVLIMICIGVAQVLNDDDDDDGDDENDDDDDGFDNDQEARMC